MPKHKWEVLSADFFYSLNFEEKKLKKRAFRCHEEVEAQIIKHISSTALEKKPKIRKEK